MSKLMKGLTQFIMDLRNSRDIEEENKRINLEINNITSKFQDNGGSGLSGYQKKKYICKLVYIYLLGHENHSNLLDGKFASEPLKLIASNVYSEKQIGYLALLVLYKKDSRKSVLENLNDLLELSHASLVKDMHSNNEEFNCLALHFIASNFCFSVNNATAEESGALEVHDGDDSSKEWLELIDLVYSFATSPIANKTIKKKAVLALVVLFKIYPGVIVSNSNWVPRILTILEEVEDLGLVTATIPLVEFITLLITPQFIKSTMTSISRKLYQIIIEDSCPREYYYYNTPAPWLVVKLLSLIESLFLLVDQKTGNKLIHLQDLDQTTINNLKLCISKSIQNSSQPVKGLPNRNSNSSILFQAVSLVVFLNASAESVKGAINALIVLLDSYETNTRYLALDALIKLIARGSSGEAGLLFFNNEFEKFVPKLFHLLEKDRDISVKRKTLDLLYTICNGSNYIAIINGILEFFTHADFNLKAELAVKIAVLSEKFATELTWYVDTMLNLLNQTNVTLSTGGHLGVKFGKESYKLL